MPSFCKAWPNQGPQGQSSAPLPPCPSPRPHQQQAVAVVEMKHQGFIQELIAGAHGVGAGLGAAAHAGVICPHLASAGGPAAAAGSANPPVSQGDTEAVGQRGKPGSGPSPPMGQRFCRTYSIKGSGLGAGAGPRDTGYGGHVPAQSPWSDVGWHCATRRARSCCFSSWSCPEL